MIRLTTAILVAAVAGAALADDAGVAQHLASVKAEEPQRRTVTAPLGHAAFCRANRSLCTVTTQQILPVGLEWFGAISRINAEINAAITFRFRRDDAWNPGVPAEGDCADVAASKLARLVAAGIPREAMRFATAYTEEGLPHLVLIVWLDGGPRVLDSRRDRLLAPTDTGYRFISLEWMWGDAFFSWWPLDGRREVSWP